ncbi:ABC transporter family protein [Brochothrix campestris FSL F6-1037]|uniref:Putative hemin import ATP-binding protein HrtA n=1 Tax=Brochothrix campestris FSL F6-1037 TaxID=1265861 RepID=W7CTF0_9LIST|nr:ABC transporter family protein [Brochothrix campestris FSL F6-1037]
MSVKFKMTDVTKSYKDGKETKVVLKNANLEVRAGEFVAIVGPSGSGKSTFLAIAGALLSATSGSVAIGVERIDAYSQAQRTDLRMRKIGFVFQSAQLLPYLTVLEQLQVITEIGKGKDKKAQTAKARHLLTALGLTDHHQYPASLSGGEKQRVSIGRALMNNPDVILADEPTASLDATRGYQVVQVLAEEVHRHQKAAIMVTHDERVLPLVDRIVRIENGSLHEVKRS